MSYPKCPRCGEDENINFVTLTEVHWHISNGGLNGVEGKYDSGIGTHMYCNECNLPYNKEKPEGSRGNVTAEMVEEVDSSQISAYLEDSEEWKPTQDRTHQHKESVMTCIVWKNSTIMHLMDAIERIANVEGRGQIAVWLDIKEKK